MLGTGLEPSRACAQGILSLRSLHNAAGLKWLVMALSFRFNFAKRAFALPFFTVLEPSEKSTKNRENGIKQLSIGASKW